MDFSRVDGTRCDSRVLYNQRINIFKAIPEGEIKGVVIYCHGLGSDRKWVKRFCDKLLENNLAVYAFDFPGHGQDDTDFFEFTLSLCVSYLNEVIDYVRREHNTLIYLFGSSFGGFVILNRLISKNDDIEKTILMCPAINFCEILENKSKISDDYFNTNQYMPLYNNIKIYKQAYDEFKDGDLQIKKFKFNDVAVIQGMLDRTVNYKDVENFCRKNNLKLKLLQNGEHELYGNDNEILDFLISIISN